MCAGCRARRVSALMPSSMSIRGARDGGERWSSGSDAEWEVKPGRGSLWWVAERYCRETEGDDSVGVEGAAEWVRRPVGEGL